MDRYSYDRIYGTNICDTQFLLSYERSKLWRCLEYIRWESCVFYFYGVFLSCIDLLFLYLSAKASEKRNFGLWITDRWNYRKFNRSHDTRICCRLYRIDFLWISLSCIQYRRCVYCRFSDHYFLSFLEGAKFRWNRQLSSKKIIRKESITT